MFCETSAGSLSAYECQSRDLRAGLIAWERRYRWGTVLGLDQRAMRTATRCSLLSKYNLTARRVATPFRVELVGGRVGAPASSMDAGLDDRFPRESMKPTTRRCPRGAISGTIT